MRFVSMIEVRLCNIRTIAVFLASDYSDCARVCEYFYLKFLVNWDQNDDFLCFDETKMFRYGIFVASHKFLLSLAMITLFAQCLLDLRYADSLSAFTFFFS
jgi:hypothetical protein